MLAAEQERGTAACRNFYGDRLAGTDDGAADGAVTAMSPETRARPATPRQDCPCGSGRAYAACCDVLHQGGLAATAEALMRARYSAYVLRLAPYLLETWHPTTRPPALDLEQGGASTWLGLTVRRHEAAGDQATVEFVARYRQQGRGQRLHEISRFVRENGRWYYLDGRFVTPG